MRNTSIPLNNASFGSFSIQIGQIFEPQGAFEDPRILSLDFPMKASNSKREMGRQKVFPITLIELLLIAKYGSL